ncbi:MAG: YceI family protein [Verrucomicrobiota bacterium]
MINRSTAILFLVLTAAVAFMAGRASLSKPASHASAPPVPAAPTVATQIFVRKIVQTTVNEPAEAARESAFALVTVTNRPAAPHARGMPMTHPDASGSNPVPQTAVSDFTPMPSASQVTAAGVSMNAIRYRSKPSDNTKVRIEGTSSIHDWWAEGKLISGSLTVDGIPWYGVGPVAAEGRVVIPVNAIHSSSGAKMDEIMYDGFEVEKQPDYRKIVYVLEQLIIKKAVTATNAAECDSKGWLIIHGVTNKIDMPVTVQVVENQDLQINGVIPLKMTQFNIQPPCPKMQLGIVKAHDDIKIIINWRVTAKPKD